MLFWKNFNESAFLTKYVSIILLFRLCVQHIFSTKQADVQGSAIETWLPLPKLVAAFMFSCLLAICPPNLLTQSEHTCPQIQMYRYLPHMPAP